MTTWNKEEALDQIKHGGRFGHKRVMEKVYKHNCEVRVYDFLDLLERDV